MKYISTVLCLVFCLAISAQTDTIISITYQAESTELLEIFDALETQYGIRFTYATDVIEQHQITGKFVESPLEEFLTEILSSAQMEYKMVSKNVLIRKSENYQESKNKEYEDNLHLRGKVTSELFENQAVDYASISVLGTSIGTYADKEGQFDIEIPRSLMDSTLMVSYVGLKNVEYKISELENEYLVFSLSQESAAFEEIIIVNRKKPISFRPIDNAFVINSSHFNNATSSPSGYDVNRAIQLLPGVTAHNDMNAEILIRGSNSDETLVTLDGIPLYETTHYHKIFSAINSTYIDSITVYKNSYPLEYGGKTAGLVKMQSHLRIPNKVEGEIVLDMMKVEGRLSIPISENLVIAIGARSSLGNIANNRFNSLSAEDELVSLVENFEQRLENIKSNPSARFSDVNGKIQYKTEKNKWSINFYSSDNFFQNATTINYKDKQSQKLDYDLEEQAENNTLASSFNWNRRIKDHLVVDVNAYAQRFQNTETNILQVRKELMQQMGGPDIKNPDGTLLDTEQDNEIVDVGVKLSTLYKQKRNEWNLGLMMTSKEVDFSFKENKDILFNNTTPFNSISAFTGLKAKRINDKLKFDLGLRVSYYSHLKKLFYSPRTLISYQLTPGALIKVAASHYEQVVRKLYYEYRGAPKELWVASKKRDLPTLQCTSYMLGTTLKLRSFTIDIEGFRRHLTGLVEYTALNPGNNDNDTNKGRDYLLFFGDGITSGIDILLNGNIGNFESYLSYTLSISQERYPEIYSYQYFISENDRRHQVKWVNSYLQKNWLYAITYIYSSGRYYTDITNIDNNRDIRNLSPEDRLSQLPAYSRLDVSATYSFDFLSKKGKVGVGIVNLFNTQNVSYIQSISTQFAHNNMAVNTVIGTENQLLDRTFNVLLSLEF